MGMRDLSRRSWLLGIVLVAAVVTVVCCLAATNPNYFRLARGYLHRLAAGGPLVADAPAGQPGEVVSSPTGPGEQYSSHDIQLPYTRFGGDEGVSSIRVIEDATGHRWLEATTGSQPLTVSPDGSRYFFDDGELYLVNGVTLQLSPLNSPTYQGKSHLECVRERGSFVCWAGWPQWSPDGRLVYFITDRSGHDELWRVDVETLEECEVLDCGGETWKLDGWTRAGKLVVEKIPHTHGPKPLCLLDLGTLSLTTLLDSYSTQVCGSYAIIRTGDSLSSPRAFCDLDRGTTVELPAPPEGYRYTLPFDVSPNGKHIALWLAAGTDFRIGVIDVGPDSLSMRIFPPPANVCESLFWGDDETLVVHTGSINDFTAASYAVKVGDGE